MTDIDYRIRHFTVDNPEGEWFEMVKDGTAPRDRRGFAERKVGPLCVLGSLYKALE